MAESDVEIAIQGKLDKIFADYPLTPRLEMLKIEIKRTLMQDAAVKVTDGAEPVDAGSSQSSSLYFLRFIKASNTGFMAE